MLNNHVPHQNYRENILYNFELTKIFGPLDPRTRRARRLSGTLGQNKDGRRKSCIRQYGMSFEQPIWMLDCLLNDFRALCELL